MHNYRELKIWKKSMLLTKDVYIITSKFPDDEKYNLISQIRRSAVSIPSNIAEGSSRVSNRDFNRFLEIACGSLFELETQLELGAMFEYIDLLDHQEICAEVTELQKMIYGFKKRVLNSES